ncbi:protease-4 [Tenacibaculum sp. MAR_2009_124]|uniref:S49 family peptidase n=1 Tax=Tenacibaculum sp. MAR_2009_124 TaxID=1250059 RepID=UPI00089559AA|nr:S49 family peptidase [Tenacibaculum sp. MAR_2009_124]SEC45816.1 protease-4 [Tenacibaculum sp. MAR_2009_124]
MDSKLHSLFQGAFYIDYQYGISCLPTIYQDLTNKSSIQVTKEELIAGVQSNVKSDSSSLEGEVLVIDFKQPVVKFDYGSWLGTQTYIKILETYKNNPNIIGVVFDIDSGGGQVYGTGEFYDYIKSYPKPIVTYTNGYMCSGAYYFAAATKYIVAHSRADAIGSIGAYSTIIDSNGIWEHFGGKVHVMYASKSKGKNSNYREVIENSNYEPYIKNELDPIVEDFHDDMKAVRGELDEAVFDGSTWTGKNSLPLGLIDEIGSLNTAINKVYELAKENTSSSNSNTNSNMSKQQIEVPAIQKVLGFHGPIGTNEKGSYLQEDQLNTLNGAIEQRDSSITSLQTTLNRAQEATSKAETAINAALDNAEIEYNAEDTLSQKITMLNDQRNEFAKNPSTGKTQTGTTADPSLDSDEPVVEYEHNKVANEILNR